MAFQTALDHTWRIARRTGQEDRLSRLWDSLHRALALPSDLGGWAGPDTGVMTGVMQALGGFASHVDVVRGLGAAVLAVELESQLPPEHVSVLLGPWQNVAPSRA